LANGCIDERGLQKNKITLLPSDGGDPSTGSGGSEAGSGGYINGGDGTPGGTNGGGTGPTASGGTGGSANSNGGSATNGGSGGSSSSAAQGGSEEAGSDGVTQGGSGGSSGSGGTLGNAGAPAEGRCPDLDQNGVLDCDETVVKNASFDKDTAGWSLETGAELDWEDHDGWDHDDSGSLGVTNQVVETMDGNALTGARQCIPITGGTVYAFAAQISMPDYAGETVAGIQLNLFDSPGCTGTLLDHPETNWVKGSTWNVVQYTYLTQPTAVSAMVRLVAKKPFRQTPVAVLFDNVLFHTL